MSIGLTPKEAGYTISNFEVHRLFDDLIHAILQGNRLRIVTAHLALREVYPDRRWDSVQSETMLNHYYLTHRAQSEQEMAKDRDTVRFWFANHEIYSFPSLYRSAETREREQRERNRTL